MSTSPKLETQQQEKKIVIMKDDTSSGVSHYQIIPKYPTGQQWKLILESEGLVQLSDIVFEVVQAGPTGVQNKRQV